MFCKYCGKQIPENAKFCSKCGKKIQESGIRSLEDTNSVVANVAVNNTENLQVQESKAEEKTPVLEYKDISINGRRFVYLGDSSKVFCSKCHNKADIYSTLCSYCNSSFCEPTSNETIKPLNSELSARQELSLEATEKSRKKPTKRIIIIACILAIIIPVGLKVKKEIDVKSYEARMRPIGVAFAKRYKEAANEYLENPTNANSKAVEAAFLDVIEVYLDYYRGMVAVKGKGDYSYMNEKMEMLIAKCEDIHRVGNMFSHVEDYDSRMTQIRAEWRAIKQQY